MIIAVFGTRGFPNIQGGVERHCEKLYPLIAERGHDVMVFARSPYVGKDIYNFKGVKIIPLYCPKSRFFETIFHTFYATLAAKKARADIVHIHAVGPSLFAPLARLLGMKVIMTTQGPDYERKKWGFFAKAVLKLGEKLGCIFADRIISVTSVIADDIRKKYNKKSAVIPNGVEIPNAVESRDTLVKFGIRKNGYILAVGRFVPEKGFDDLILAYKKSRFDGTKLVIAGDADHENEYSKKLKDSVMGDPNIILTGFLTGEPLEEIYSNAGLFVLPSYHEGLPFTLLEAMSYGLRCLASDIPANRCVKLNDNNYFGAGNIKALSDKIKQFIEKPLSDKESKEQIEILKKDYDWDIIAQKTLKIYEELT